MIEYFWLFVLGAILLVTIFHIVMVLWSGGQQRSAVDWDHVYKMEREVWGQTFKHIGAPPEFESYNPFSNPVGYRSIEDAAAIYRATRYLDA